MDVVRVGDDPLDKEALEAQVREDPNPELVLQHDEDRDPLDIAIVEEHEIIEEEGLDEDAIADEATREELVELVLERVKDDG